MFQGEDTATVTIKYIDNFGKTIAADDVFYGLNDSEYHFEAKELFGYSFIESDLPLDGKYNGNMTITLKYQLHCDKTDLKKEIFEPFAEEHGVEVVLEVGNNSDRLTISSK